MCNQDTTGNRITSSKAYSEAKELLQNVDSPLKGRQSPLKGRSGHKHSEETKEYLRKINLGRSQSEVTRTKKSISGKNTFINGRIPANKGKTTSQEVKDKISKKLKGRVSNRRGCTLTVEQKQKMSESIKLAWQKRKTNEEGIIYNEPNEL